ncbi:hypothetical protein ACFV8E_24950 [Streptomyces sp. NPDC059849]|uniref:hypothetical protein n=1 Tax=Streptomyces sp. NPDC059849 TaxID=3346969 RepID=UPI003659C55E
MLQGSVDSSAATAAMRVWPPQWGGKLADLGESGLLRGAARAGEAETKVSASPLRLMVPKTVTQGRQGERTHHLPHGVE